MSTTIEPTLRGLVVPFLSLEQGEQLAFVRNIREQRKRVPVKAAAEKKVAAKPRAPGKLVDKLVNQMASMSPDELKKLQEMFGA